MILGTKGRAILPSRCRIEGENPGGTKAQAEHVRRGTCRRCSQSIRAGKPINNGDYMFTSTMLAILAQMVCYTGQEMTWEQAMQSTLDLRLPELWLGRRAAGQAGPRRPLSHGHAGDDEVCLSEEPDAGQDLRGRALVVEAFT